MSLTILGLIVAALGRIADMIGYHGLSVTTDNLVVTLSTLAQVFGLLMAYIGRYRQGDITWYGGRIPQAAATIDSLPQ